MADYEFDSSDLTQEQIELLGGNALQITYIPVWDANDPAGWQLVASGSLLSLVVCPKPCGRITLPPPQ